MVHTTNFCKWQTKFGRKGQSLPSVELGVVAELVLLVGDIRSEVGGDVEKKSRSSRFPLDWALWGKKIHTSDKNI